MFERLSKRVGVLAERRAQAHAAKLVDRLRADLPRGIDAEAVAGGAELSGRGIVRRFALDPALRWLLAGLK